MRSAVRAIRPCRGVPVRHPGRATRAPAERPPGSIPRPTRAALPDRCRAPRFAPSGSREALLRLTQHLSFSTLCRLETEHVALLGVAEEARPAYRLPQRRPVL